MASDQGLLSITPIIYIGLLAAAHGVYNPMVLHSDWVMVYGLFIADIYLWFVLN